MNANKPRGLITEINVCKTIRQKIFVVFYDMKCSKCESVACEYEVRHVNLDKNHHLSQFILASANSYCIFHIAFVYHVLQFPLCTFMQNVLYFSLCTFTLLFLFGFLCYWSQTLLIKWFNFVFIIDPPSVSLSNVQAITAEIEEQHTLSNIIHIKFRNGCFFSLRSILKEVLLICT